MTNTVTPVVTVVNRQRRILVVPIGRPTFDLELGAQQVAAAMAALTGLDAELPHR